MQKVGGDNRWGFSLALFIGVLAGTYSSIYIANVVLIWLNLNSEDLIPPAATGKEVDDRPGCAFVDTLLQRRHEY